MPPTTIESKKLETTVIKQRQLDGTMKNVEVLHYEYRDKKISIKEIEEVAKKIREKLVKNLAENHETAKINLVIQTPWGHRSGNFVDVSKQNIHVWNPHDFVYSTTTDEETNLQEWYDSGDAVPDCFWFNVIRTKNEGGCDNSYNDCLYDCLFKVLSTKVKEIWSTPDKLKKYLKINRDALINTEEHMDLIEKKINTQIFIQGDIARSSKINSKTAIHISLVNAHYTVSEESKKPRIKGVSYQEQMPLVYHYDHNTGTCILYDGKKEYRENILKIREIQKNRLSSKNFILKIKNKSQQEEVYNTFCEQADKLKQATKGLVNLYKTSGMMKTAALSLFDHYTKHISTPDNIQGQESMYILNCYRGGLMKAIPYEGTAYKYDVDSHYPAIMASLINFPYKQGQYKILKTEEMSKWKSDKGGVYYKYGIYRCIIEGDINPILFYENQKNMYTHIDLALANKLGYTITLINDGQVNFLEYPPDTRVSGKMLFQDFVDLLYSIKKQHRDIFSAKSILNILWGALSEKRIHNKIYTTLGSNDEIILDHDETLENVRISIQTNKQGQIPVKYETVKHDNIFVSGFARISPFLTAAARSKMANLILENVDDISCIKRIHTDGIISSVPLKQTYPNKGDTTLGQLAYEGKSDSIKIVNMRKPLGEFFL